HKTFCVHSFTILHVELVSVSVPLRYLGVAVDFFSERALDNLGWPCAQSHACPFVTDATLFLQQGDYRLWGFLVELSAVGILHSTDVPHEFNRRHLHAKTQTEIWNLVLPRVTRRVDFSFNTASAKSARNQDAAHIFQLRVHAVLQRFGIN